MAKAAVGGFSRQSIFSVGKILYKGAETNENLSLCARSSDRPCSAGESEPSFQRGVRTASELRMRLLKSIPVTSRGRLEKGRPLDFGCRFLISIYLTQKNIQGLC